MAFIDEKGQWVGPGPDPRRTGSVTQTPAQFNVNSMPNLLPASGYTPNDWTNIIQGNSGYMNWKLSASERADVAASNRKAALRALAVRYGGLPGGFKDVYGDIDESTLATSQGNPLSESARLSKNYADSTEQYKRSLAARHALQSGDLGYGLDQLDFQSSADRYDLSQQFMDVAQQVINSYGGTLAGLNQELINAIRQAAQDVYDMGYRLGVGNVATGQLGSDQNAADWITKARPGGLTGGAIVGNGEVKMANSQGDLDVSGGWGVLEPKQGSTHHSAHHSGKTKEDRDT
jgi:hypothetical protein